MNFTDTQVPSNCLFNPNMDIKTWKPGVALMLTAWQTRMDPQQSFNDAIDEQPGWVDAIEEEYIAEEEYEDWAGKPVEDCITDYCDSSWVAAGKIVPKDFEVWQITWDDNANTFNCCDIQIVVDAHTKEILMAMTRSD